MNSSCLKLKADKRIAKSIATIRENEKQINSLKRIEKRNKDM
jgi:hypothetical protein